jgi:hypothetical protein
LTFQSSMYTDSTRNSPSCSTWIIVQSITWLGSSTFYLIKTHETNYEFPWMQWMQSDLSSLKIQMAHGISLPTLGNFPILATSFYPLLLKTHAHPLWILCMSFYLHNSFSCPVQPLNSTWFLSSTLPFPFIIMAQ